MHPPHQLVDFFSLEKFFYIPSFVQNYEIKMRGKNHVNKQKNLMGNHWNE